MLQDKIIIDQAQLDDPQDAVHMIGKQGGGAALTGRHIGRPCQKSKVRSLHSDKNGQQFNNVVPC